MIVSRAPMRISFVGGGTDIAEYYTSSLFGAVVSAAISEHVHIMVTPRFDDLIRVVYSKTEVVDSVDGINHNLVREAMKLTEVSGGVEIVLSGDMPIKDVGSGLGASSSLMVALLHALYAHQGKEPAPSQLAEEACRIERNILENPGGKQDQYAAAFGGVNYIQFNRDDTVEVTPLNMAKQDIKKLEENTLLFYTGLPTKSHDVQVDQRDNMSNEEDVRNSLDEMVQFAEDAKRALEKGRVERMGELLHQNWIKKQKLSRKITNPEIDRYYKQARDAGAIGGKISGSGGGGFLLFYCEADHHGAVRNALKNLKELPVSFDFTGSTIVYRE